MRICKNCFNYDFKNSRCNIKGFSIDKNENAVGCGYFDGFITTGAKIYIEVWQIFLEGMMGWCTHDLEDFREELESINEDYYRDEPNKRFDIDFAMNCLRLLPVGEEITFKDVTFKKFLMDNEEYNNSPEFTGW